MVTGRVGGVGIVEGGVWGVGMVKGRAWGVLECHLGLCLSSAGLLLQRDLVLHKRRRLGLGVAVKDLEFRV